MLDHIFVSPPSMVVKLRAKVYMFKFLMSLVPVPDSHTAAVRNGFLKNQGEPRFAQNTTVEGGKAFPVKLFSLMKTVQGGYLLIFTSFVCQKQGNNSLPRCCFHGEKDGGEAGALPSPVWHSQAFWTL